MKVEIEDIKKFELLPGETLVVKISRSISSVYSKNFRKNFEKMFPDNKLLFIADGLEIHKIIKNTEG